MALSFQEQVDELKKDWATNPRWKGVKRDYSAEDVVRLRGSVHIEHSLARRGAEKLWKLVNEEDFVPTLGALTGGQAVQQRSEEHTSELQSRSDLVCRLLLEKKNTLIKLISTLLRATKKLEPNL